MSDCEHNNRTIDCGCNDCGYDLIVEPQAERYRQEERERIVKLLEEYDAAIIRDNLIALIKGEEK